MTNRLWWTVILSAGFAGVGVMPAVAADPLLFSFDGQTWETELGQPIFGETVVLVPGDERSASFWVRNSSPDPADLKVVLLADWPAAGEDADELWVHAAMDGSPATSGGETDRVLLGVHSMDPQDSRKVTVTVGLDAAAGNSTQNLNQPMAFDVRLTQSIPGEGGQDSDSPVSPSPSPDRQVPATPGLSGGQPEAHPGEPFGMLPDTGFTALWWAVSGAALTAGGLLAVACSRKKKNTNEEGGHGPT